MMLLMNNQPLLEVRNLKVEIPTRKGTLIALEDVSFSLNPGEILGVVGESGAGKSMVGNSIIGLLGKPAHITHGEILLEGKEGVTVLPLSGTWLQKHDFSAFDELEV